MCLYSVCMTGAYRDKKQEWIPLEPELQMIVSCHRCQELNPSPFHGWASLAPNLISYTRPNSNFEHSGCFFFFVYDFGQIYYDTGIQI